MLNVCGVVVQEMISRHDRLNHRIHYLMMNLELLKLLLVDLLLMEMKVMAKYSESYSLVELNLSEV